MPEKLIYILNEPADAFGQSWWLIAVSVKHTILFSPLKQTNKYI